MIPWDGFYENSSWCPRGRSLTIASRDRENDFAVAIVGACFHSSLLPHGHLWLPWL